MATQENNVCVCTRNANKIHCPHCGCATVYGLASRIDKVTRSDNSIASLRVYRCRKCACTFNDDDWQLRCTAPLPAYGKPKAQTTQRVQYGSLDEAPEFARNALAEVMRKRGIK